MSHNPIQYPKRILFMSRGIWTESLGIHDLRTHIFLQEKKGDSLVNFKRGIHDYGLNHMIFL